MKTRRALTLTLSVAAAIAAGEARAEDRPSEVYVDVGFNTRNPGGANLTTWTPNLGLFAAVDDNIAISADWGLTTFSVDEVDLENPGVKPLNPFVAAHLTPQIGDFSLRLGLGLAIPVAEGSDEASLRLYESARAIRGSWDPWLYATETISVAIPARVAWQPLNLVRLAAEGAAFLMIATDGSGERLGFQGALEAALVFDGFEVGARIQGVRPQDEVTRAAFEPFAAVGVGPVWLRGRLTMNLAEPDGFAFDEDGIWGAHLGLAYTF
ncbi:MAG: hypothetical protein AAFZ18_28890 [Myxococcota bacterium]